MTHSTQPRSLSGDLLQGSLGFAAVSLGGFAVWALAGGRFGRGLGGEVRMYGACLLVFLLLAGLFLRPLVRGDRPMRRLYGAFLPAFFAYAVVWSLCWFKLGFGLGEWLGSFLGCALFALLVGKVLGSTEGYLKVLLVLFITHSAGYFLGGLLYYSAAHPPEFLRSLSRPQRSMLFKLGWGLFYGLGFGLGIGYTFHQFQKNSDASKTKT